MSVQSLSSDFVALDDNVDVTRVFAILDSLVDVSFDGADLELDDALDYLKDLAVKCEN